MTVFRHYLHQDPAQQSYVAAPGALLSSGTNLALSADGNDSAYDMSLEAALSDIPHTGSTATISFAAGGGDWDGGTANESWAMDNLSVTVSNFPRQPLLPVASSWSYLDNWQRPGKRLAELRTTTTAGG